MTPDEIYEAQKLLKTLTSLEKLLEQPEVKDGIGEISLLEDVSESGHGTRAWVQMPEADVRHFARRQIKDIAELLHDMDVEI